MLDFDPDRPAAAPKDAATVLIVRDGSAGLEVFVVERSKQSRFASGAIVFPGGKVDPSDADERWLPFVTPANEPAEERFRTPFANDAIHFRALAIAAARETLEEAALLHARGIAPSSNELQALRATSRSLWDFFRERNAHLDLTALHPFARWITPTAESRRFDARFFVALAPPGQEGAHDDHETMASFWATPASILERFTQGEVQLVPPTHASLSILARCPDTRSVLTTAALLDLEPVCPRLVRQKSPDATETLALAMPGDPEHGEDAAPQEVRTFPCSRYVLRGDRWLPENAPCPSLREDAGKPNAREPKPSES